MYMFAFLFLFKIADINQLWGRRMGLSAKLKGISLQLGFHLCALESWPELMHCTVCCIAVSISVSLVMPVYDETCTVFM